MDKYLLEKIIIKVKDDKYSKHQKASSFEIYDGAVIIKECCCSDFYKHLQNIIQEEMDSSIKLF